MAIHGTLKTMSLTDLLQFLAAGRKTGTLKFDRDKITKQIFFQNGLIAGSKSNDPREYLGQLLLHYGKLDEHQLQVAREVQRKSGGKLGEVVVAQGFLSESDVLEVLKTQTLDAIYDLFVWEEGDFEFYDAEHLPEDLIRIEVEPTTVIMEGIYRIDELARYHTLVPSDRTVLELGAGWTSSLSLGKELRQILYFVEKRMSVAEICYNMHSSSFHVYGQLYDLISKGFARVTGEIVEAPVAPVAEMEDLEDTVPEMLVSARRYLDDNNSEKALLLTQRILQEEPKNLEAQDLLHTAEEKLIKQLFESELPPHAVPQLLVTPDDLTGQKLGPQEGFVLSRINGEWDIESILSICPFRDADCLLMIKKLLERGIIGL
jgi:hypothetical protein